MYLKEWCITSLIDQERSFLTFIQQVQYFLSTVKYRSLFPLINISMEEYTCKVKIDHLHDCTRTCANLLNSTARCRTSFSLYMYLYFQTIKQKWTTWQWNGKCGTNFLTSIMTAKCQRQIPRSHEINSPVFIISLMTRLIPWGRIWINGGTRTSFPPLVAMSLKMEFLSRLSASYNKDKTAFKMKMEKCFQVMSNIIDTKIAPSTSKNFKLLSMHSDSINPRWLEKHLKSLMMEIWWCDIVILYLRGSSSWPMKTAPNLTTCRKPWNPEFKTYNWRNRYTLYFLLLVL